MATSTLLSPASVAALLGISEKTLAMWRYTGRFGLPFIKVGALVRYRQLDVDSWLQSRLADHTGSEGLL